MFFIFTCPFKNGIGSLYRYEKQKNFLSLNMRSLKTIEVWSSFHIKNTIHCADSIMSSCHSIMSVCLLIMSSCHSITISYQLLVIQLCPFVIQLCLLVIQLLYLTMPAWYSIMFDIIFQLLLFVISYPWSFSHLIIIVCHAISYFMNFIELRLVAIQLFNIDSISIDRLYLSPAKAPLNTDWGLRAGFFAPFLHEVWKWRRRKFKMWAIPTEKKKIINEH